MAAKKTQTMGRTAKPVTVEITYIPGNAVIDNADTAAEVMQAFEDAQAPLKDIMETLTRQKEAVTAWAQANDVNVIQLEESYWRRVVRMTRRFVATKEDMPDPAPKGAKSLREIVMGKKTPDGKPLWNFITVRVPDADRINAAVTMGYLTEKEVGAAYIEAPQKPFIQRYEGEADD